MSGTNKDSINSSHYFHHVLYYKIIDHLLQNIIENVLYSLTIMSLITVVSNTGGIN